MAMAEENVQAAPDLNGGLVYRYRVRLPGLDFEGPLDLLLLLIQRNQLPVTEIALAAIADEFMAHMSRIKEVIPAELADFVVIAARLLYIKSEALLPSPPQPSDRPEDAPGPAEELLVQLREYSRVKTAAAGLQMRQEQGLRAYPSRRCGPDQTLKQQIQVALQQQAANSHRAGLAAIKLDDLLSLVRRRLAAQRLQQSKQPAPAGPDELRALVRSVKIEDKIALLQARLNSPAARPAGQSGAAPVVEFSSLFDPDAPPGEVEVIVTFMAVLELLRRQQLKVWQAELFGEIYMEKQC